MSDSTTKPLMTLAVAAFNQERFVRESVQGAFAQTYPNLEIILSDDNSKDKTFEIMTEMAASYRGPHQVVLNRNPTNKGLAAHSNRILSMAKGKLVVLNAGDDVSLPHRVEAIAAAWWASGEKCSAVHSRVINMDQAGRIRDNQKSPTQLRVDTFRFEEALPTLKRFLREENPVILGCTAAWSRELYERFGPLPLDVVYEDMALGFRARLLGGVTFIDDPLVLYRLHDANIHHATAVGAATLQGLRMEDERRKTGLERRLAAARSFQADLKTAESAKMLSADNLVELLKAVESFARAIELELNFRRATFFQRLSLYSELRQNLCVVTPETEKLSHQLLPRWFYYAIRLLKARLRKATATPQPA